MYGGGDGGGDIGSGAGGESGDVVNLVMVEVVEVEVKVVLYNFSNILANNL